MLKKCILFSALALGMYTTPSFASFLLDQVMSKDVQKKTGVDKLTPNQKIALEAWLNQNFDLKNTSQAQNSNETQLLLSINIDGGKKLQLSDGSIWEIAPTDVPQSSIWITPFPVKIVPSNDPDYPMLLVNKVSGISVKARRYVPNMQPSVPSAPQVVPIPTETAPAQGATAPGASSQGPTGATG